MTVGIRGEVFVAFAAFLSIGERPGKAVASKGELWPMGSRRCG
jgi:hypothetical protein